MRDKDAATLVNSAMVREHVGRQDDALQALVAACEAYLALHGRRKGVSEAEAKAAYAALLGALARAKTLAQ